MGAPVKAGSSEPAVAAPPLEALAKQIEALRTCPAEVHYGRCVDLALRLLNAETAARDLATDLELMRRIRGAA